MKFTTGIVAFFALLFVGCGSPRLAVNPKWTSAPDKFTVIVSEPYVANSDDISDDFGEDESFKKWSVAYLNDALNAFTFVPHSVRVVDDNTFMMAQLPLEDGFIGVPLPVKEKMEGLTGIVVCVHPVRFWREMSPCHNRNGGCINNKSLNLNVMYSIVSVENSSVLAYGGAYDRSSFTFAMTKGDWENVVEGIAKKIVEKTPLQK